MLEIRLKRIRPGSRIPELVLYYLFMLKSADKCVVAIHRHREPE